MSRIPPAPPSVYEPLFGADAPVRRQVHAQASHLTQAYVAWMTALRTEGLLPGRLVELVRLRVAFHNQCRSCMSIRYSTGAVDEGLVCSLEEPEEAADLTEPERAALAYADLMATDHLRVDDSTFARLHEHFTPPEVMELCLLVGSFVGYGRMDSSLDLTDDLPEEYADHSAELAPWRTAPVTFI